MALPESDPTTNKSQARRTTASRKTVSEKSSRAVLTTGANSGFGLACVLEIARRGYRSIGTVRSPEKAESVKQAAAEAGVEVETLILDVTDGEACAEALADLPLYGLVNNAGISAAGAVEDVDDDTARQAFETMVLAPMRLARLALPGMRERSEGRIICMSSMYGKTTTALNGWYQGAKHALEGVSDALRVEVAGDGVDVILVEPGFFKTAILEDAHRAVERYKDSHYHKAYEEYRRMSEPVARYARGPEPVAKLVARILDSRFPRSRYLVGIDAYMLVASEMMMPTPLKDRLLRKFFSL